MSTQIQINDKFVIDSGQLLGKGSTGNVYLGWSINDPNQKLAVKAIDLSQITNEVTQYLLSCEIVALTELSKLQVSSIVKLVDVAFLEGYCYLVMELLEGGSLADYIKQHPNGINERQVLQIFKQVFQAYNALRNQGIVHRDIKPDNLIFRQRFVDQNNRSYKQLCMIDFGYCTKESVPNRPKVYYNVGSPKYMSPQAFRDNIYSQKSDIWALGVILYEMLHGKTVDAGMDMEEYFRFMKENNLAITRNISQTMRNLLIGMLTFDHQRRHSCDSIQQALNQMENPSQMIPPLSLQNNGSDRRNSLFYRSQILSHRSEQPDICSTTPLHQIVVHDPRKNQNIHFQGLKPREMSRSPNKNIYFENSAEKTKKQIIQHSNFINIDYQMGSQFTTRQIHHVKYIRNGGEMGVLQKIEQEQIENRLNRQRLSKNSSHGNLIGKSSNERAFLKSSFEAKQLPQMKGHPQIIKNQNNLTNSPNLALMKEYPMRKQIKLNPQLVQSAIFSNINEPSNNSNLTPNFQHHPVLGFQPNTVLTFKQNVNSISRQNQNKTFQPTLHFRSQETDNSHARVKQVRSDKFIPHKQSNQMENDHFNKSLNKSFSTQNLEFRSQQNQNPSVITNSIQLPSQSIVSSPQRPIERIIVSKQSNNLAFLRSTLPPNMQSVYRSTIQIPTKFQHPQIKLYGEVSSNGKNQESSVEKSPQKSVFNTHNQYFDSGFKGSQKERSQQNNLQISRFNAQSSIKQEGRNQKSNSFKMVKEIPVQSFNNVLVQPQKMLILSRQQTPAVSVYHQQSSKTGENRKVNFAQESKNIIPQNQFSHQGQSVISQNHFAQPQNQSVIPQGQFIQTQFKSLIPQGQPNHQNQFVNLQGQFLHVQNQQNNLQHNHQPIQKVNFFKEHPPVSVPQQLFSPFMHQKQVTQNQVPNLVTQQHIPQQHIPQHQFVQNPVFHPNHSPMIPEKQFHSFIQNQTFNPKGSFIVNQKTNDLNQNPAKSPTINTNIYVKPNQPPNNIKTYNNNPNIYQNLQFGKPMNSFPTQSNIGQPIAVTYH